eukprot:TRINITY_DN13105_c0_g1_i1.p1 TRINITY_DN13105_c0_g1~~TRINITY_DN13105_c0_g1_i1.p1  ORF type:complete len:271 (-),score=56.41 TRINITY_DN13105_c0_g1_i1:354-1166(-)
MEISEEPSLDIIECCYHVTDTIACGSTCQVLLAHNPEGEVFALKTIEHEYLKKKSRFDNLTTEIKILSTIDHPRICKFHCSFVDDDLGVCMVLDYYPRDLFDVIDEVGHLSERQTKSYGLQILDALDALHEIDVVYRDLKLENILVQDNGDLVLADFGLCKFLDGGRTQSFCGTPDFLAPEMILGMDYGKEVDFWQFGILLYEMLVGVPPFLAANVLELYNEILLEKIWFPTQLSEVSVDLIKKLTKKSPRRRLNDSDTIRAHEFFVSPN